MVARRRARPLFSLVLFLSSAVGIPLAVGLSFSAALLHRPWLALSLFVVYETIVLIVTFVGKVWRRIENIWVDRAVQWITALEIHISRHRRRYCEHLGYRHRDFDVKGLTTQGIHTLELERVFVELRLAPQAAHRASPDPLGTTPTPVSGSVQVRGRHVIWNHLGSRRGEGRNLVVIGAPGSGKTTLLKHAALVFAHGRRAYRRYGARRYLPVLLFFRAHSDAILKDPNMSLVSVIHDSLTKEMASPPTQPWIRYQLTHGHFLVMCDGLDEVADESARKRVAAWIEHQMTTHGNTRFILTSRPFGYRSNPLQGVTLLEICPFTSDQVQHFVENWYLANEIMSAQRDDPGVRLSARDGADDLLKRLKRAPALTALAANPLLLTMTATVHRYRSSLPGRRVELYAEICEVFLGKRQQARGLASDLTPGQKQLVLQVLAYEMMSSRVRELPVSVALDVIKDSLASVNPETQGRDFLQMIENSSGLLLEKEAGVYSFAHLTVQEYLASVHVKEHRLERQLLECLEQSWWHETIRLYVAQQDATGIIEACLVSQTPTALALASECVEEGRTVRPDVRVRLRAILTQQLENVDPEQERLVAETLLTLRLRQMLLKDASDDVFRDDLLVTNAEYQLFLDEQRAGDEYCQPDHWDRHRFAPGQAREPVLGVRSTDAVKFCAWLTAREGGVWRFRLPNAGELVAAALAPSSNGAASAAGYWTKARTSFVCEATSPATGDVTAHVLHEWFLLDVSRDRRELSQPFERRPPSQPQFPTLERLGLGLGLERVLDRARGFGLAITGNNSLLDSQAVRHLATISELAIQVWSFDSILDLDKVAEAITTLESELMRSLDVEAAFALLRDRSGAKLAALGDVGAARQSLCWFLRLCALVMFREANHEREASNAVGVQWLGLYEAGSILDRRISGAEGALEGIRLVQDRSATGEL